MKCKKCGCDTLIKSDDWYTCASCGAVIFDTEIRLGNQISPTKIIEKIEQNADTALPDIKKDYEKENEKAPKSKMHETIEFCIPMVIALIIAILLKTFIFANAVVPTGSMLNTIHEKDRIIASRLSYINDEPQRYDIVILKYPDDESQYFVKRIIGLPGETVEIIDGIVYITQPNGEVIQAEDDFITNCKPNGDFGPYTVPEDSYFMLGDNRNSSLDSRYWDNKYVHRDKILGKVKFRYYPSFSKIQ